MGTDLPGYIQRFELILFFAGYPLLYTLVSGMPKQRKLLPIAHAMAATLFLLFLLWQANRSGDLAIVALRMWGVLAMLLWIPRLRRLPILSLLHSLVFFGLMVRDIVNGLATISGRDQVHNDMTIFSLSFLLNTILFALVLLVDFVRGRAGQRPGV